MSVNLIDPKLIKKLADTCRKAGIESFEGYGIKFTLAPKEPRTVKKALDQTAAPKPKDTAGQSLTSSSPQDPVSLGELSPSELLFWSVGPDPDSSPIPEEIQ